MYPTPDDMQRVIAWSTELTGNPEKFPKRHRHTKGMILDVFPLNVLSDVHLSQQVNGIELRQWILQSTGGLTAWWNYRVLFRLRLVDEVVTSSRLSGALAGAGLILAMDPAPGDQPTRVSKGDHSACATLRKLLSEYRNDPHNLPESEIPRIAGLLKNAIIPARHLTRKSLEEYLLSVIMFPGYGLSLLQMSEPVALNAVEVPQMDEDRWITAVAHGDATGSSSMILCGPWLMARSRRAEYDGTHLRYYDCMGALLRKK